MRLFHSLSDFREFSRELAESGDQAVRREALAGSFLVDPVIVAMPDDPFSDAYRRAVHDVHARICGRPCYDVATTEPPPPVGPRRPGSPLDGRSLGDHLERLGRAVRRLDVRPGMRVVEHGCGDGELSVHLARLGCDVTVVAGDAAVLEVVRRRAELAGVEVSTVQGDVATGVEIGRFDRIFLDRGLQRTIDHHRAVANHARMLLPDGLLVSVAEPVVEPAGPWNLAVPYPWGPRLDGLSLEAMQADGQIELGFQRPYIESLLARHGLGCAVLAASAEGRESAIVARHGVMPADVAEAATPRPEAGADVARDGAVRDDLARDWHAAMLTVVGTRDGEWFRSGGRDGVVLYGPYMPMAAGHYHATFELVCESRPGRRRPIATCDVACGVEGRRLTSVDVHDAGQGDRLEIAVAFSLSEPTGDMQFRVIAMRGVPIRVRACVVVQRADARRAA